VKPALFYPSQLARADLFSLVRGQDRSIALDVIRFDEPAPHRAERELAVPFLPGMDDIEVAEARLALRAASRQLDTEDYTVTANGSEGGVFLSLPLPALLRKLELSYTLPAPPLPNLHLVVRAATRSGTALVAGTPLFADPPFARPGPMFPGVLAGMTRADLGGNRRLFTLPSVLGQAWLIQLAVGTEARELNPLATVPTVNRVTLDAAPRNLSVVLLSRDGEVKLWNNPEALLPDAGEQEVSFTPLASKELAATLARQNTAADTRPTLPVRLRFDSDTVSAVDITRRALVAEYLVRPVGGERLVRRLAGSPVALTLRAPAGLTPRSSQLRLTVKHLGRELNAASPEPPVAPPPGGVRADVTRQVATAFVPAPRPGQAPGSTLRVASVRLRVTATEAAEAVLEIRADVAGVPGPPAAAPIVRQLDRTSPDWVEFELAEPLAVVAGQAPLWLALRVNKGEVCWFAAPGPATSARVSTDRGATWAPPDPRLMPAGALLTQLFDVVAGAPPTPVIRVGTSASLPLVPSKSSRTEWVADTALPAAMHSLLGSRPGQGKVPTELRLSSRSALDLTVESLVLRYDPFATTPTTVG